MQLLSKIITFSTTVMHTVDRFAFALSSLPRAHDWSVVPANCSDWTSLVQEYVPSFNYMHPPRGWYLLRISFRSWRKLELPEQRLHVHMSCT